MRRSRTRSTGRVSDAILRTHTALRPADRPAIWIPCGDAAPDWTWRLRPALRLLFFFFGKRLSTMRTARPDSGHVSSRPTGSLRRALNQRPIHCALNVSADVCLHARAAPPHYDAAVYCRFSTAVHKRFSTNDFLFTARGSTSSVRLMRPKPRPLNKKSSA